MEIYPKNRKMTRDIAIGILGVLLLNVLGVLSMFGINLNSLGLFGYTVVQLLQTVGLGWVIFGLFKYKI